MTVIHDILSSRAPHCKKKIIYNGRRPIAYIDIQMKRKEQTKAFMMFSNYKNPPCFLQKIFSASKVKYRSIYYKNKTCAFSNIFNFNISLSMLKFV